MNSTGVHTPGVRSGALEELPRLEAGFSRSGEFSRRRVLFDRFGYILRRYQANNDAMVMKYRMALWCPSALWIQLSHRRRTSIFLPAELSYHLVEDRRLIIKRNKWIEGVSDV